MINDTCGSFRFNVDGSLFITMAEKALVDK